MMLVDNGSLTPWLVRVQSMIAGLLAWQAWCDADDAEEALAHAVLHVAGPSEPFPRAVIGGGDFAFDGGTTGGLVGHDHDVAIYFQDLSADLLAAWGDAMAAPETEGGPAGDAEALIAALDESGEYRAILSMFYYRLGAVVSGIRAATASPSGPTVRSIQVMNIARSDESERVVGNGDTVSAVVVLRVGNVVA